MFLPEMAPDQADAILGETAAKPRYNIAPTQSVACIARRAVGEPRELFLARWGFVPSWSDDLAIGSRMINARSETVDSKPSFKRAFAKRRCLIPTDGYYEWMKTSDGKQPYLIHRPDHEPLWMAGLWEVNRKAAADGQSIITCTIMTTNANELSAAIHDRMPVFLSQDHVEPWLDPAMKDVDQVKLMLTPASEDLLKTTAVSKKVSNVRNDDAECVKPIATTPTLFD